MSDNPYAPPRTEALKAPARIDPEHAVALRAALRGVERLVRSIGIVYFLQAAVALGTAAVLLLPAIQGVHPNPGLFVSSSVYLIVLAAVLCVAGYGLVVLATWSRLCALFQTFYLLAGFTFGLFTLTSESHAGFVFALLHSLPFYILFGPKAGYVLSPAYAAVVAATPGRVPGAFLLALLIAAVFVGLIATDFLVLTRR